MGLIQNSFLLFHGITEEDERNLWNHGITYWDDLEKKQFSLLNFFPLPTFWEHFTKELKECRENFEKKNVLFFWDRLPYLESWRIFGDFPSQFWGLDIETTGLGEGHKVTCICVSNGIETYQFTRTQNLEEFHDFWETHKNCILVTYNGYRFDIPFLKKDLDWNCNIPHLDLMHILHKMNIKGGLKGSEVKLGISRDDAIVGMTGKHAVYLWNQYVQSDSLESLRLLQKYNEADTKNLIKILEIIYQKKKKKLLPEEPKLFHFN